MKFSNKLIILILVFALIIRSYSLLRSPPSLFSDEVDAAYQAHVFNQCGTDYQGNKLPIHFHSFSDNRTSAYIYSIALVQKFTGPTPASARIPSIIFGTLSILALYLFVKAKYNPKIALISAFLLSLSPWAIHYSRTGFEVSGMILFYLLGLYFFEIFKHNHKSKFLSLSAICFVVTPYFYSTAKLFILFTGLVLAILNHKLILNLKSLKKNLLFLLPALLISIPLIISTLNGESGYRFSYISIFTDPTIPQQVDSLRLKIAHTRFPDQVGLQPNFSDKLFINKYVLTLKKFTNNYLASFSSSFLFIKGDDNLRHSATHGVLYFLDLIFIFFGLKEIFKSKSRDLLILLLLSPIPFALTRDSTSAHATRLILMLPFLVIFISLGVSKLLKKTLLSLLFFFLYLLSFFSFYHQYLNIYPQESAAFWHKNIAQTVSKVIKQQDSYQNIYFSNSPEPILPFYLFYSQYIPQDCSFNDFASHQNLPEFNGLTLNQKYHFGNIEWPQVSKLEGKNLFIVSETEIITIRNNISNPHIIDTISSDYETAPDYFIISQEN